MHRLRWVHLGPCSGSRRKKCLITYKAENKALEPAFPKLNVFKCYFYYTPVVIL